MDVPGVHPALQESVTFVTKEAKVFGMRTFWRCRICGAEGADEPGIGKSAAETVLEHFAAAKPHFDVLRRVKQTPQHLEDLERWMRDEMSIFGRMSAADAAGIASQIAKAFYAAELRERDDKIAELNRELENRGGSRS